MSTQHAPMAGWVETSDDPQRHYYQQVAGDRPAGSLCGRGLRWSWEWIGRYGRQDHAYPLNCPDCQQKRLQLLEKDAKVN